MSSNASRFQADYKQYIHQQQQREEKDGLEVVDLAESSRSLPKPSGPCDLFAPPPRFADGTEEKKTS
ncbi:MAG TPA: hypothetical protein V6D08_12845 [Candidatus Obscuribacterales bacterium]